MKKLHALKAALRRYLFKRQLNLRERYLLDLLDNVPSHTMWGLGIQELHLKPSREHLLSLLDDLAKQHFDSPDIMADVLGYELALQLPVHRVLKQGQERHFAESDGVMFLKVDLRKLHVGTCFTMTYNDLVAYEVLDQRVDATDYRREDLQTHPLRTYPKEEGPIWVYLVNLKHVKR